MSELFSGCTEACAVAVSCPTCGRDLPPKGRSVAPETHLPSCCDEARFEAINTRHVWSVDELPARLSDIERARALAAPTGQEE